MQEGNYSEIIYNDIGQWFEENNVNYERTSTGVNMLQNISAYIRVKGFLPAGKNSKTIFLEKFTDNKIDKVTLNKAYKLYCENRLRKEHKSKDELKNEIQAIPEFASLTEGQRSGLIQSFLKENEKEFELSDDRLDRLNHFIQQNINNCRKGTDYELLHKISEMMVRNIKITNRNVKPITTPSTKENTQNIALEFIKSIDAKLHEQAKNIVEGNSDIAFKMYKFDKNTDFSLKNEDGLPLYTKMPCVFSRNGRSTLYMPYRGTVEDISLLVHELSHTFDLVPNDNSTRNLLGKITPYCFSAMLSQYLVENNIASKEDMINGERGQIVSHYDDGAETFTKLELMKIKQQKGNIEQGDISALQKKYGLTNHQCGYVLDRVAHSEPEVDYKARYMIAQLVYPHYMEQYNENPKLAIETLKEYFEMIKANNFTGSLDKLGIPLNIESVSKLIEINNRRIHNLEYPKLFSENEIGKATINVLTLDKDKIKQMEYKDQKETSHTK